MGTPSTDISVHAAEDLSAAEVETSVPRALSLRAYLSGLRTIELMIALAIFAMFLPTLIVPYAFSDDYALLSIADGLGPVPGFGSSIMDTVAASGRPFAALLDEFFFSAAGTIDNLRFVRLFAIVGIVALALLLHWALVRSGIKPAPAALIAVFVCSMPAFQVYSSWAVLFTVPYAAILGGGASLLAVAATDAPRNLAADRMIGATGMLLAALLIYQPAAMFFWVFLAVALVGAVHDFGRALRMVRTHFGVAAVALPLGFLALKLVIHTVGDAAPNPARNALAHDLIGKGRWFFEWPLYRSLNLFDLTPSRWLAAIVGTITVVGIPLLLLRRGAGPLPYIGIAVLLVPLSALPALVVAENQVTYRSQVSISSLIALYACLGALGIWLTVRDWLRSRISDQALIAAERFALAMSVAFVATSAFAAARNVTTLFVVPQSIELRMIRSQMARIPAGVPRIAFVQPSHYGGMTKLVLGDEFGLPSSTQPWTPEASVLLILREEGRLGPNAPKPIVDPLPPNTATYPKNEPVVDVRGLSELR